MLSASSLPVSPLSNRLRYIYAISRFHRSVLGFSYSSKKWFTFRAFRVNQKALSLGHAQFCEWQDCGTLGWPRPDEPHATTWRFHFQEIDRGDALSWYRQRKSGPLRPLPAHSVVACSLGYVADPCSHVPLSDDAQHVVPAEQSHTTHHNPLQLFSMALPGQSDEERLAIEQQVFSNEDLNLDSVAHTRVRRSGVYTQVYHFCLGKAFQEGRRTRATGGSMPVGSAEIIYGNF